jgi:hypothetical protein
VVQLIEAILQEQKDVKEAKRKASSADFKLPSTPPSAVRLPSYGRLVEDNVVESDAIAPETEISTQSNNYGYRGCISREEAEALLKDKATGTFLVRWSERANSYVISYVTSSGSATHVADINEQDDGTVSVTTKRGKVYYHTIEEFVSFLQSQGTLSKPIE